jgi:hypothetical protein
VTVASALASAATSVFMALLTHLPMAASPMAFPPFPIGDVPFAAVHVPVVMGDTVNRAGNVAALYGSPRSVIGPRPIPAVSSWAPPVAVIKEYVEIHSRHEIDIGAWYQDHFRWRRNNNRRRTDVDADSNVYPC